MAGPALLRPGPPPPPPLLLLAALLPLGLGLGLGSPGCGARVDVRLRRPQASYTLQGAVLGGPPRIAPPPGAGAGAGAGLQGRLVLVGDEEPQLQAGDDWIGVVPVGEEQVEAQGTGPEESFTSSVVNKMKRALVLGASALLILALNQNSVRELDVSQVLSKPIIVVQMSDNVTKLLSALLGGLQATAKITSQATLLENVGLTLTLWSTCGLSRGGLYGEWQGVICPGESGSRVQKYLQKLWNTILLVASLLCMGLIIQARRQARQGPVEPDPQLDLKQHILQTLSALKTRRYHPGRQHRANVPDIQTCAICLDRFHRNQCLRVLPCLHEFHQECIDPWLLLQQTCPLCKHNILGSSWAES
ncbi:RING finger protein 215 isoform X1 [Trichosurus vulpecula]|uniref:RING finger protein 215 isoform X1 n=1 Tax=Trichosurus vulpecula TaxID=9337 RepID=UPI00186B23E4|nr:RING finger protein 215 isoform X1 [Trichosurus vulpecula]